MRLIHLRVTLNQTGVWKCHKTEIQRRVGGMVFVSLQFINDLWNLHAPSRKKNVKPLLFAIIASVNRFRQHLLSHITKSYPCRRPCRHPVQSGSLPSACLVVTLSRVGGVAGEEELSSAPGPRETGTRLDYSEDAFHRQTVCFEWQCSTNTPRGTTRYTSNSCGWRRGSWAGAGASFFIVRGTLRAADGNIRP